MKLSSKLKGNAYTTMKRNCKTGLINENTKKREKEGKLLEGKLMGQKAPSRVCLV